MPDNTLTGPRSARLRCTRTLESQRLTCYGVPKMIKQSTFRRFGRYVATWGTAGVLMSHSCSSVDLENLMNTVEAVANALVVQEDDDITFLDYLLSEFD